MFAQNPKTCLADQTVVPEFPADMTARSTHEHEPRFCPTCSTQRFSVSSPSGCNTKQTTRCQLAKSINKSIQSSQQNQSHRHVICSPHPGEFGSGSAQLPRRVFSSTPTPRSDWLTTRRSSPAILPTDEAETKFSSFVAYKSNSICKTVKAARDRKFPRSTTPEVKDRKLLTGSLPFVRACLCAPSPQPGQTHVSMAYNADTYDFVDVSHTFSVPDVLTNGLCVPRVAEILEVKLGLRNTQCLRVVLMMSIDVGLRGNRATRTAPGDRLWLGCVAMVTQLWYRVAKRCSTETSAQVTHLSAEVHFSALKRSRRQ